MRRPGTAALLVALALLAGACTSNDGGSPLRPIPWHGAPGLELVWEAESGRGRVFADGHVAGNVVVAYDGSEDHRGNERDVRTVFIDGTSGRIVSHPKGLEGLGRATVYAATDARGRPLVGLDRLSGTAPDRSVYTPDGRFVWAGGETERFAGGYVAGPRKTGGAYREVIRTLSGRVVARLPMPDYAGIRPGSSDGLPGPDDGLGFQQVRPGFLVVSGIGVQRTGIALVDVSRPGRAKVGMLRTPDDPDHVDGVRIAVTGGRVYATWPGPGLAAARYIARYDTSGTRPVWQRPTPAGSSGEAGIRAFTDPESGAVTVAFTVAGSGAAYSNNESDRQRYWLIRPDTGAPYGPRAGRPGIPFAVYGGRLYVGGSITSETATDAVDQRTGTVRRIRGVVDGVTTKGYVIGGYDAVNAYHWE